MNEIVQQEPTKEQLIHQLKDIQTAERWIILEGGNPLHMTQREKGMIVVELTTKHGMTHEQVAFAVTMGAR